MLSQQYSASQTVEPGDQLTLGSIPIGIRGKKLASVFVFVGALAQGAGAGHYSSPLILVLGGVCRFALLFQEAVVKSLHPQSWESFWDFRQPSGARFGAVDAGCW